MIRYKIIILLFGLMLSTSIQAQNFNEAINLSSFDPVGTSAFMSTGGSASSLGADFSLMSVNPAGLGEYKNGVIIFTPSFTFGKTRSYLGNANNARDYTDNYIAVGFENIGFVVSTKPNDSKWVNVNYAFGLNRQANFKNDIFYQGESQNSIIQRWQGLGFGNSPENLSNPEAIMAYNAGAIYGFDESTGSYLSDLDNYDGVITQSHSIRNSGINNELVFAVAGNYNNKISMGLSVGMPIFRFNSTTIYREEDPNLSNTQQGDIDFFNALRWEQNLATKGTGINLKGGVIVKPTRNTRLGLGFSTPTLYKLTDDYQALLGYDYTDDENNGEVTSRQSGYFKYRFTSPWTANIGLGKIFRNGFLSGSVDYVDYRTGNYNFTAFSSSNVDRENQEIVNAEIDDELGSSVRVNIGGEYNFNPVRLRAGVRFIQSPYANDNSFRQVYSAGLGFRFQSIILDIGYSYSALPNATQYPYLISGAEQTYGVSQTNKGVFAVTIAYRGR